MSAPGQNYRILLIDDNPAIHDDFRKILLPTEEFTAYADAKALVFGEASGSASRLNFQIDSAFQGQEGLEMVERALRQGEPYAMAFVDVRMPPGWDGVETISRIWQHYPELQIVICTAYSDYSWEEMIKQLGHSDNLLILKKPFDNLEVLQMAYALTKKWNLTLQARIRMEDLDRMVNERTQELQLSEERFSKAFRTNPLPMVIQRVRDERFVNVNDSFLELSGYSLEEVLGCSSAELNLWADAQAHAQFISAIRNKKSIRNLRLQLRTHCGQCREMVVFAELFNSRTEPYFLTLMEDVSERLNLESQLRQAQKMEAIGQLAAGVAHDFNNMLTIIQGHVSLVLLDQSVPLRPVGLLRQALAASERAGTLTRQLLAFSRKQVMERRPVKLPKLFDQLGGMLQRLIGEHITLEFQCPADLPPVYGDPCNIEQVIMNLAVNARDAMPQGGHLVIAAKHVEIGPTHKEAPADVSSGRFICISVTDTGCGMDAATQSRIFEPFFTTKEVGKGTGMGLATVYGIVKQHKGWIELDSQLNGGTTFRVYLPVSVELINTGFIKKPAPPLSTTGSETILVVEDEPFLREFVQTALETHGYNVLLAGNGAEAQTVWQQHSNHIALLLTDMVMPGGTTGKELAEILRSQSPSLKVIFSSGYSLDVLGNDALAGSGYSLLQKPYQTDLLVTTVRQCLDSDGGRGVVNNRWAAAENF